MTNALEANALSKQYGSGTWALRDLTLSIPAGAIVGLVGPNGAGKSTLLKSWMGFEKATKGCAVVLGMDPWAHRSTALTHVAYLAQSPAFYKDLSVADHLSFVTHYRGEAFDRNSAERRLTDLRIPLRAKAGTLSGGQAAQLGLAIAFSLSVDVLLLDEPLAALDPLARRETIEFLTHQLSKSGATAVLSSHIISDIEHACSRVVVLSSGEVALQGTVTDVVADHYILARGTDAALGTLVSELPDRRLLCRGGSNTTQAADPAGLEDIVIAYLTAGRSS
jgi:ABC-2 type transport system ATP-binding protein